MTGWLPRGAGEIFGDGASSQEAYGLLTVDVPAERWIQALTAARDELGCTYFDWLSAVDEPGTGFWVCAHLVAVPSRDTGDGVRRLVVRTTVPHDAPALPTATGVYAGAAWHERETHEMFGVDFADHPHLAPLLLPEGFEGHPLRKDFILAARVAKAWPGAKEPGESEHGGPRRRQMLPPGVPDPNEWGPLKGQLPPAPSRPARAGAAGDRPARGTRTAAAGSAGRQPGTPDAATPAPPRRARSAAGGSASQRERRRGTDAPWHDPHPATGEDAESRASGAEGAAAQGTAPSTEESGATSTSRAGGAQEGGAKPEARPSAEESAGADASGADGDGATPGDAGNAGGEG